MYSHARADRRPLCRSSQLDSAFAHDSACGGPDSGGVVGHVRVVGAEGRAADAASGEVDECVAAEVDPHFDGWGPRRAGPIGQCFLCAC